MSEIYNIDGSARPADAEAIVAAVSTIISDYRTARTEIETVWTECWAAYLNSRESLKVASRQGNVKSDWRHQIHSPKAFENTETVIGYLTQAFFPNSNYFDVAPRSRENEPVSKIVKAYLSKKFVDWKLKVNWTDFIRQETILGTSVVYLPWEKIMGKTRKRVARETVDGTVYEPVVEENTIFDGVRFETLSMFDLYLDPGATDPNDANLVRNVRLTAKDILRLQKDGYLDKADLKDLQKGDTSGADYSEREKRLSQLQGYTAGGIYKDRYLLQEFWGDIEVGGTLYCDYHVIVSGHTLLRFAENPHWGGKPFVVSQYTKVPNRPYGIGAIEPVLGLLQQLDNTINQKLDNGELILNNMWEISADSGLTEEDMTIKPGKVFQTTSPNSVRPLLQNYQGIQISQSEIKELEADIASAMGVGLFLNAGAVRSGERVTATEVQAAQGAGGNRLNAVHVHIEEQGFKLLLAKCYSAAQQYVDNEETVRVIGASQVAAYTSQDSIEDELGEYEFGTVGPEELTNSYDILPLGAAFIADREYKLNQMRTFIADVASNPMFSQHIDDWAGVVVMAEKNGFDDWERFLKRDYQVKKAQKQAQEQQGGVQSGPSAQDRSQAEALLGPIANDPAQLQGFAAGGGLEGALQNLTS